MKLTTQRANSPLDTWYTLMKNIFALSLALLAAPVAYADFQGKVIKVADGDTITVLVNGNTQERVRLENIDAPESSQAYGQQARNFLNSQVYGKFVYVKSNKMDLYKRHIGTIYLGNYNVNQSIVQNGYAWAFREYLTDPNYIKYEQYARQNRLGLWKDNNPIYPSNWRRSK